MTLKKNTITGLFAFAILAFTACTQNEEIEMAAGRAIKFQNAAMTKGTANVSKGSFKVAGYRGETGKKSEATKVIDAEEYIVNSGFATPKYYDGVNSYWFYGYAQTGADTLAITGTETVYSESTPTIVFTTPDTANVDLVTMASSEVVVANQGADYQSVIFKHALSRVRYSVNKADKDMSVTIKSVVLNVGNDRLSIPYDKFGADVETAFADTISSKGADKTYSYAISGDQALTDNDVNAKAYTATKLYVVPQGIKSIVVSYTLEGASTPLVKTFTPDTKMLAGKAYNFQFTITAKGISFATTLEGWDIASDTTTPIAAN